MRPRKTAAVQTPSTTATVPADRRNRARLRELCDEVLASYRVARSREVITEQDRAASRALLSRIAPLSMR